MNSGPAVPHFLVFADSTEIKHHQTFIQARYEDLVKDKYECALKNENIQGTPDLFLDNDLDAALDSFDTLFCRRCLVSISLVIPLYFFATRRPHYMLDQIFCLAVV